MQNQVSVAGCRNRRVEERGREDVCSGEHIQVVLRLVEGMCLGRIDRRLCRAVCFVLRRPLRARCLYNLSRRLKTAPWGTTASSRHRER